MTCECDKPGYCPARNQTVTALGLRICRDGDERSKAIYFTGTPGPSLARSATRPAATAPCRFLGEPLRDDAGSPVLRECRSCKGTVKLKVLACSHPGHADDPTTTSKACRTCPDFASLTQPEKAAELHDEHH